MKIEMKIKTKIKRKNSKLNKREIEVNLDQYKQKKENWQTITQKW